MRFNLAGTVRSDSIRYGMVGSGSVCMAGQVGRYGVRRGVVLFGRLGGMGFGSLL